METKIRYRQGDVGLALCTIPREAAPGKRDGDRIVLAYGEVTGHAHAIRSRGVKILEHEGTRYIRVPRRGAKLEHEEHAAIRLAPGEYRVIQQREYSPEAVRNVAD
jgi:hypothetical protein